jgi:hypothetical protein
MYKLIPVKVRDLVKSSALSRLILFPYRLQAALRVTLPPVFRAFTWTFASREHTNFSYNLQPINIRYLVSFIAIVTGKDYGTIEKYVQEIERDEQLKQHILHVSAKSIERHVADNEVRFGRRLGWYALIRATKPRLAVETGIDKGLGSCLIAAALMKNTEEGFPGRMIGLDLNPNAGYLLQGPYAKFGTVIIGDSHETIPKLPEGVDFFIHDSDHAPEHEAKEFELVKSKLSANAFVLSDNSETTDVLLTFARANNMNFLYFAESPLNHWLGPAGIGVAFLKERTATTK